jgi:two-component system chemotaxis response regulator CheY
MISPYRNLPLLIVDDQASVLLLVAKLFERLGFQDVEATRDPERALELLRQRRFALAVSDWHMQPMTGLALLRAIREDDRARWTPFIITSVDMSPTAIHAAHLAGADAYLLKPYGTETLKAKVDSVLRARGSMRQAAG